MGEERNIGCISRSVLFELKLGRNTWRIHIKIFNSITMFKVIGLEEGSGWRFRERCRVCVSVQVRVRVQDGDMVRRGWE